MSGMFRQIGNDLVDLGRLMAGGPASAGLNALNLMIEGPSDFFGSNNTNAGLLGADLAPAAELAFPAIRAKYLVSLSQIPARAAGSGMAANAMRNELKWFGQRSYQDLVESGLSDAEIIQSATRSRASVNAAAAANAGGVAALRIRCN